MIFITLSHVDGRLLEDIRAAISKGLALGNERFIADVEPVTGKRLKPGQRGGQWGGEKQITGQIFGCKALYLTLTLFMLFMRVVLIVNVLTMAGS